MVVARDIGSIRFPILPLHLSLEAVSLCAGFQLRSPLSLASLPSANLRHPFLVGNPRLFLFFSLSFEIGLPTLLKSLCILRLLFPPFPLLSTFSPFLNGGEDRDEEEEDKTND